MPWFPSTFSAIISTFMSSFSSTSLAGFMSTFLSTCMREQVIDWPAQTRRVGLADTSRDSLRVRFLI